MGGEERGDFLRFFKIGKEILYVGWVSFIVGSVGGARGTGGIIWIGKEKGLCISIMKSL